MKKKSDNDTDIEKDNDTFYGVVKVSHNGQIIIPAALRKDLGIKHGDQLVVARTGDGEDIILVKMDKMNRILKEVGFGLKKPY